MVKANTPSSLESGLQAGQAVSVPTPLAGLTRSEAFSVNSGAIMRRSRVARGQAPPAGDAIGFAGMRMRRGGRTAPIA